MRALALTHATVVDGRTGTVSQRDATVLLQDARIVAVGADVAVPSGSQIIDVAGRVVMPGFVDAHTHLCWAGDRLDEWDALRSGVPYLDLLAAGGGILSTVRAVRAASVEQLAGTLRARLEQALHEGTTTIEVKSGYGLTTADELKQLDAIAQASEGFAGTVIPTALLGHALDPQQPHHVDTVIHETLPAVSQRWPGIAVDAYVETGSWSVADGVRFFEAARRLGHPVRVHADQFHALGMLQAAIALGAVSVDHLEATDPAALAQLAQAGVWGVLLPISGFHTDQRYADGRALLDAGGRVVLASNANPGTAPSSNMPLAVALAVRRCGLTPAEAIVATTSAPAALLGLEDRGVIAPGYRADVIVLRHDDPRRLAHEPGGDPVQAVIVGGWVVRAPAWNKREA